MINGNENKRSFAIWCSFLSDSVVMLAVGYPISASWISAYTYKMYHDKTIAA